MPVRARQVLVVVAALIALAGCGSNDEPAPAAATTQAQAGKAPAVEASAEAAGKAYVKALKAIDPALVDDAEDAVDNGRNICLDVEQGKTTAQVTKNAKARFEVNSTLATKIVAATKKTLCSSK